MRELIIDYVRKYVNDENLEIYVFYVMCCVKELCQRFGCCEEQLEDYLQKYSFYTLQDFFGGVIKNAMTINLSQAIRENPTHAPLITIYQNKANYFCDFLGIPVLNNQMEDEGDILKK